MQNKIIQFVLVALLVSIIGGSAGWYFFIKSKTDQTRSDTAAMGDSASASFTGQVGSTYQNIASDISGATSTNASVGSRAPRLWHVVRTPIAGFGFGPGGASIYVAERATGNVLRVDPNTSSIFRLTNTLVPKVREALFSRSGDVVMRSTNDGDIPTSFSASIATTTVITSSSTPNVLEGTYLPENIVSMAIQHNEPTTKGLFFITKLATGGSVGVTSNWKGGAVKKIFTSPLSQWRSEWLNDGRVVIVQNASDNVPGYAFLVGPTGTLKPLESGLPGLSLRYHDSNDAYLYSTVSDGKLSLFVKVGNAKSVPLSIETTADKCVWAPGAGLIAYCAVPTSAPGPSYLVNWYQGATHTIDVWWKIEAAEGTATRFFVSDSQAHFDVEDPAMDESGTAIGFRDAADKSFWLLRISE